MPRNNKDVILLIEDNPADILRTEIYLEEAINEYHLIKANTFREGSEALEKHENIDLVLLDLTLPDMQGGIKALERFLKENSDKPVIVLSGNTSDRLASMAVKSGAQDYLLKRPLTSFWLDRSIQHALQRFHTKKELEEANEALELSKNRMSIAQAISNLGEWELDLVTNKMIWSEQIYRLLNLPSTLEPRLQDYLEKVYPEDKDLVINFFEKATRDDKIHSLEHRVLVDGYQVRFIKLNARLISVERTQKLALIGSIQDISQQQMSKQNEVDKVLAQQANTIWKQIVGELEFQVRAPLSKILYTLEMLFPEPSSISTKHRSLRDQVYQASSELSSSTTRILNFSILLSDHLTVESGRFNLKNLLQQVERLIQGSTKLLKTFECILPEDAEQKLLGDQGKLLLLLYNLGLFCSLKTGNSSSLTCTARVFQAGNQETDGMLEIVFYGEQWKIDAESKDRLLGKSPEIVSLDSVLKNGQQELGLQLEVIKRLLPVLEGSIQVEQEKKGTFIQLQVPIQRLINTGSGTDEPYKPLRILVVDDHPISRTVINLALSRWSEKNQVFEASDGKKCLEKYMKQDLDLILMDIQMPHMDGLEATEIIRRSSQLPIIGLSAKATKQEREAALNAGMNDYLVKPVDKEDLFRAINDLFVNV